MKLINQLGLLLLFWLLGEGISQLIHPLLMMPGAIIGMILFAVALTTGLIKESQVEDISDLLLNNISFFFVPASVGLLGLTGLTSTLLLKIILIAIISTFTTMWVSMFVTQFLIRKKGGRK